MVPSTVKHERSKEILRQLLRDGEVTVLQLAKRLKTSTATVRRELTDLERAGLLRKTHGGAIQVEPMFYEPFRYLLLLLDRSNSTLLKSVVSDLPPLK
jgi:DeoR/GlpR family transcriptional regulator of sugar metabolism